MSSLVKELKLRKQPYLVSLRPLQIEQDATAILEVFTRSIEISCAKHYTLAQRKAWINAPRDALEFTKGLAHNYCLVALLQATEQSKRPSRLVGFADISTEGYLDHLFVHYAFQGLGIAYLLYKALEEYAQSLKLAHIETHASLKAYPFFCAQGFTKLQDNVVQRKGEKLGNYLMRKELSLLLTA